jgi:hypothetical protein
MPSICGRRKKGESRGGIDSIDHGSSFTIKNNKDFDAEES